MRVLSWKWTDIPAQSQPNWRFDHLFTLKFLIGMVGMAKWPWSGSSEGAADDGGICKVKSAPGSTCTAGDSNKLGATSVHGLHSSTWQYLPGITQHIF